ncbi:MAG: phosphodiester glycosidase family protein [Phycisphaeraceae bacterium]|nr:MAG: phosphodiester glycosidase family protein [Phycisphaeraceae bacterium]
MIRGYAAEVDLTHPAVEIVVSGAAAEGVRAKDAKIEAELIACDAWASREGLSLAVNANFFGWVRDGGGSVLGAEVIGLLVTDGEVVSGPRVTGEGPTKAGDPALVFDINGRASVRAVAGVSEDERETVWDAVAGVGASGAEPGTLLVEGGKPTGETARVDPEKRHPRTAAGVNKDGTRLILLVIDGRREGHSVGATLPEAASILVERGAWAGLNLDGGGSSSFWYDPTPGADGDEVKNRPSDGAFRPVAGLLGVKIRGRCGVVDGPGGDKPGGEKKE